MNSQPSPFKPAQYGLAIHTSSPALGLAISNFSGDCRAQAWNLGRDLSTQFHLHLAEFLRPQAWSDLAFIAVAKGPGGFTGTRMGVVTARTIAQQLEIPLFAISSLAVQAWAERATVTSETPLAVQMQAQRGEVFGAIYQASATQPGLQTLLPDRAMSLADWQGILDRQSTPYHLLHVEGELGNSALALLELADLDWQCGKRPHWSEALPFYGQHPVVEPR